MIYFPTKPRSGHHIIANVDLWMDTIFYMVFLDNIIANIIFIKSSFFGGTVKFPHEQYLLNGSFSEKFCWNCLLDLCNCTIVHDIFLLVSFAPIHLWQHHHQRGAICQDFIWTVLTKYKSQSKIIKYIACSMCTIVLFVLWIYHNNHDQRHLIIRPNLDAESLDLSRLSLR